jgi:long-chain acyl-CoA synthetase
MLGYYRNPEATAEALKDGWFHTGDLGKIEDHYLFITGRTKNLIITSSGENISPEELEEKVLADPAVAEAIVYDVDDVLAVQIYPEKEAGAPAEYFQALLDRINKGEPVYRQLKKLVLRDEPFIRNSTGKIIRTQIKGDM